MVDSFDPASRPSRLSRTGQIVLSVLLLASFCTGVVVWIGQTVQARDMITPRLAARHPPPPRRSQSGDECRVRLVALPPHSRRLASQGQSRNWIVPGSGVCAADSDGGRFVLRGSRSTACSGLVASDAGVAASHRTWNSLVFRFALGQERGLPAQVNMSGSSRGPHFTDNK